MLKKVNVGLVRAALVSTLALTLGGVLLAAQLGTATIATPANERFKDSFYFVDNGVKYLAVSDLNRGGITLLRSQNGSDTDYRYYRSVIGGNNWAPTTVDQGNGVFLFVTTEFAFNNSYLNVFSYNVRTGARSGVSRLGMSGGEQGMTDATIWYEPGKGWYMAGARWGNYLGCRLVWARADRPEGPYTAPQELYDSPTVNRRVDYDIRGNQVDYVVEAPAWSWWDHTGDGRKELFWSIGHSDPKDSSGACKMHVKAIRRGDINWRSDGRTPWIYVFDPQGGDGDIMANNMDCYHLTHPDFTQDGRIRATSMKNNSFTIVNMDRW